MYTALVYGVHAILHAIETWTLTKTNLQRNNRAMIRQICSTKPKDVAKVRSREQLAKLEDLDLILRERRLRWSGHVERSSGTVRTACDIQIEGRWGAGRSKLTWRKLTEKDCHECKLTTVDPHEKSSWRSAMRSAMLAVSQLPLIWMMPLHLQVNQKIDYDDDDFYRRACILMYLF